MLAMRSVSLGVPSGVSELSDEQLRLAIAREVLGLKRLRWSADGRLVGEHPTMHTMLPVSVPDWFADESDLSELEDNVIAVVGRSTYRSELAKIAGDFNPKPSPRSRCEASLSAIRRESAG